jgi:hypothetical protein
MERNVGARQPHQLSAAGVVLVGASALAALVLGPIQPALAAGAAVITQQCSLSSTLVYPGATLTATGSVQNIGTGTVKLSEVVFGGRPPGGTHANGPYDDFTPNAPNVTLSTGQSFTLTASRSFTASDPTGTWYCFLTFATSDGTYHDGQDTFFTVATPALPLASFTYSPANPVTGQPVSFDGSASACPATPCNYRWTDDADSSLLGTGLAISFSFGDTGTKYVRLTVTDALGNMASVEHNVSVGSAPAPSPAPTPSPTPTQIPTPTPSATPTPSPTLSPSAAPSPTPVPVPTVSFSYSPANPVTGQAVSFDGSATTCVAIPCSYAWTDDADQSQLGTGPTMSFTFMDVGTKYVRLTVTDALRQTASIEHDVVVGSAPAPSPSPSPAPTVSFTFSPASPLTGQAVSFDGSATVCVAIACSYRWTDDADNSQLGTGITMSFTFQDVGTKYVRLTVTDALGQSSSIEHDVVVAAPAPSSSPSPTPGPTPTPTATATPAPTPSPSPSASAAATWYVSRNGSNADGSSWATAWSELSNISWSLIHPGDTILIDGGAAACPSPYDFSTTRPGVACGMLYNTTLTIGKSGTASAPITIKLAADAGHDGTAVFFGGRTSPLPYCTQAGYSATYSGTVRQSGISIGNYQYLVIDGRKRSGFMSYGHDDPAHNDANGVTFSDARAGWITVRNMEIFDNGFVVSGPVNSDSPGVRLRGHDLTFERLLVHDNGQDEFQGGASSSAPITNITIRDSWLYMQRENPAYAGFGFNAGPSQTGCTHADGIQIYPEGTGGEQSGLTFANDILGPLLDQGIYPSDTDVAYDNTTINNVLFINSIWNNINSDPQPNSSLPSNWKVSNVTAYVTPGAAGAIYGDDSQCNVEVLSGSSLTLTDSIFVNGCIHFDQSPLSGSGNLYWNTSSSPAGTVTNPLFAGPLPGNNNPSFSTLASVDFTPTCGACSGKGAALHRVQDILDGIDQLNG